MQGEAEVNEKSAARIAAISASEPGIPTKVVGDLKLGPSSAVLFALRVRTKQEASKPDSAALYPDEDPPLEI
jgi:hypothetical protein